MYVPFHNNKTEGSVNVLDRKQIHALSQNIRKLTSYSKNNYKL